MTSLIIFNLNRSFCSKYFFWFIYDYLNTFICYHPYIVVNSTYNSIQSTAWFAILFEERRDDIHRNISSISYTITYS